jgi:hypothetical protein
MQRILRVVLAIAILVSSVGISVVTVACVKASPKQTISCPSCKKDVSTVPRERKACCVYTLKHFSIKSEITKPYSNKQVIPVTPNPISELWNATFNLSNDSPLPCRLTFVSPPASKLDLITTLRI